MKDKYLSLFGNCKVVEGASRALIIDLQNDVYYAVPLGMTHLLKLMKDQTVNEVLQSLGQFDQAVAQSYFEFLTSRGLAFYLNSKSELERFPEISDVWEFPYQITNAILELSDNSTIELFNTFIADVSVNCLQVFYQEPVEDIKALHSVAIQLQKLKCDKLQLNFLSVNSLKLKDLEQLLDSFPRIEVLVQFGSESDESVMTGCSRIVFTTQLDFSFKSCGNIGYEYMTPNTLHYTESINHNTCLNRKISVDSNGEIRNCPAMGTSFGNIRQARLEEILDLPEFRKYWHITKAETDTCRDCEFRNICTDCRAFLERPDDLYSKPLKCGYNPYTNEWTDWSKSDIKEKIKEFYSI